jgi:hypothetical protein
MAKSRKPTAAPPELPVGTKSAEGFVDNLDALAPAADIDPKIAVRDAEIARLREELAALKAVPGALPGGRVTVSWKDGPTLTIEVRPGESAADSLARYGVHSTPHKLEVARAADDAPLGQHMPNGSIRPFVAPAKE